MLVCSLGDSGAVNYSFGSLLEVEYGSSVGEFDVFELCVRVKYHFLSFWLVVRLKCERMKLFFSLKV